MGRVQDLAMAGDKGEKGEEGEQPPSASATPEEPVPDQGVALAFSLGWQMAKLHLRPSARVAIDPEDRDRLPGVGDLQRGARTQLQIAEVKSLLHRLGEGLEKAGVDLPSTQRLDDAFESMGRAEIRAAVYRLHVQLLERLMAANFRYGKAYGLGRALADTCRAADADDLEQRWGEHRISALQEWLNDLQTALPPHSARAVSLSMDSWRTWVSERGRTQWESSPTELTSHLARQGHLWRALLSGEKEGTAMLEVGDYTQAADRLVGRSRAVLGVSLRRYRGPLSAVAGFVVVGVVAASRLDGAGEIIGVLGTAAAALGATWKGVGSTLATLASQLRAPLWGAELDDAIAVAIDRRPQAANAAPRALPDETPPSGPARGSATDPDSGPTPDLE